MTVVPDHDRVRQVFEAACDLPPDEQEAFVRSRCADDTILRDEVLSLLKYDRDDGTLDEDSIERGVLVSILMSDQGRLERIGEYRVVRHIGAGGMGDVYECEQQSPRRRVAIKIIRSEFAARRGRARFEREIEIQARLRHPAIAQIFECGFADLAGGRVPYFVMELVQGVPLTQFAVQSDLSIPERLEVFLDVCEAIEHAHAQGVIHRDLKPDNILIETTRKKPRVKVLDFGIAKLIEQGEHHANAATVRTESGQLIGTLSYMSPEQVEGESENLDVRTDVFSLGAVLYELLAGNRAFDLRGRRLTEAARIIREHEPSTIGSPQRPMPRDIETIVFKALEKDPDRRYQTVGELAEDIRRYLADVPIVARPPSAWYQLSKFARRNRVFVGGTAATMLALLVGVIGVSWFALSAVRSEREAIWHSYRATIAATTSAIMVNEPTLAERTLNEAAVRHRGWEWDYLDARLRNWTGVIGSGNLVGIGVDQETEQIFAVNTDGNIEIWSPIEPRLVGMLEPPQRITAIAQNVVNGVAWCLTLDGALVTLSTDDAEAVWEIDPGSRDWVGLVQSIDGSRVFAHDGRSIFGWESMGGEAIAEIEVSDRTAPLELEMDCNPQGTLVAAAWRSPGPNRRAGVFDVSTGASVPIGSSEGPAGVRFSRDGSLLAVPMVVRNVHLFATSGGDLSGIERVGVLTGHEQKVRDAVFLPDGRLASLSGATVLIRRPTQFDPAVSLVLPDTDFMSLMAVGASRLLTFSSGRGQGHLWRTSDLDARVLPHQRYVYFLAWSPDSRTLATAAFNSTHIGLWDVETAEEKLTIPARPSASWPVFTFSPDGEQLLATVHVSRRARRIDAFSTSDGSVIRSDLSEREIQDLARAHPELDVSGLIRPSPNGSTVLVREGRSGDRLWMLERDGDAPQSLPEAMGLRRGAAWHPSGAWFVIGGTDRAVLSVRDGDSAMEIREVALPSRLYALDISPDGTRVATGTEDGIIRLYDTRRWDLVFEMPAHRSYIYSIRFSPDGTMLATASGDTTVKIFDRLTLDEREALERAR